VASKRPLACLLALLVALSGCMSIDTQVSRGYEGPYVYSGVRKDLELFGPFDPERRGENHLDRTVGRGSSGLEDGRRQALPAVDGEIATEDRRRTVAARRAEPFETRDQLLRERVVLVGQGHAEVVGVAGGVAHPSGLAGERDDPLGQMPLVGGAQ